MSNWQLQFRDWLPDYINGNLAWPKSLLVRLWLNQSSEGRDQYQRLLTLRQAVRIQPSYQPSAELLSKIQERLVAVPLSAHDSQPVIRGFEQRKVLILVQVLLVALAISLFWRAIPPGNMLQWTSRVPAESFRIYRAPASAAADEFILVRELSADESEEAFTYLDIQVAPGQDYVYRVETVQPSGSTATSDLVFASGQSAFMGQLLVTLAFVMVILIMVTGLKRSPGERIGLSLIGGN